MIEVSVLGRVEARVDGRPVEVTSRTQRILLAALAHARGEAVPTERLIWITWGDQPPASARQSLKSHLSRLRRLVGPDVIVSRGPGYALTIGADQLDLTRFERGLASDSPAELAEALALWRGEPFDELTHHEHLTGEATRLTELRTAGRLRRADLLTDEGSLDEAISELRSIVADQPFLEPARIALVATLHLAGRQADAIAETERYRSEVAEVGLAPSSAFIEAERRAFTDPAPPQHRRPQSAGSHLSLAPLIGRTHELDHLSTVIDERRLVTLLGPGGVGKTALASELIRHRNVDDGTWVANLAEVEDETGVLPAVVRAVGAPTTQPLDVSLANYLASRTGILLLDNIEHVVSASCRLVEEILGAADGVRILTTGRRPLGLPGEAVVAVEPLTLDAAVDLLTDRCRDVGGTIPPDLTNLAERVCERLDRLPLAIEMAAARLRALSLDELDRHLGERLRLLRSGRDGRHETLADVVAWSHDLLDDEQRQLFAALSLFAGPFDLDAGCAIHGSDQAAGILADLVDQSLLQADKNRAATSYQMLETIRSFAHERLDESPTQGAAIDRFVAHHVDLAEAVERGLYGPDEAHWAQRFDEITPNLEAAHARALERGDVDSAVRIATAPYVLIYHRLRADIAAWADATLEPARRTDHPATPAVLAVVALDRLNRGLHDETAELLADLPLDPVARHAYEVLGDLHTYHGNLDEAVEAFARAEELARAADDPMTACHALMSQTIPLGYSGRHEEALALVHRARSEGEALGAACVAAWCDFAEAELMVETDPDRALDLVDRAVAAADRGGWRMLAGVGRLTASSLRARSAEPADAVAGFEHLIRYWDQLGDDNHQWTTLRNLVDLLVRLGAFEDAAQILGSVANAPRPSFGPEQQRLGGALDQIRRHLGTRGDELAAQGSTLDLPATVGLGLDALRRQ